MTYNVLDIARYIIKYSNDQDYGVSNLKLQKILYFIQAYFLIQTNSPCFKEPIEAWDFGPVVPTVYKQYKMYASADVPTMESYISFDGDDIWKSKRIRFNKINIKDEDKILINKVVDKFSEYSATDLVTLTQHQTPWIDAFSLGKNNEISLDTIKDYFSDQKIFFFIISMIRGEKIMYVVDKESLACYMINKYKNDYSDDITPIKLQKGLYFLFAFWGGMIRKAKNDLLSSELDIKKYDEYLFEPNFEAWTYGPVDYDIYSEFEYDNEMFSIEQNKTLICDKFTRSFIDNYLDRIFITNDFGLIDLSYEDNAWKNVYNDPMKHIKMNPESIINEYAKKKGVPAILCN